MSLRLSLIAAAAASAAAGPCDVYAAFGTPCAAAHSVTRALFDAYQGPLYQVHRFSDNATLNIFPVSAGGAADAARQDAFCAGTACDVYQIYDQTWRRNDLARAPPGGYVPRGDAGVNASRFPTKLGGAPVYGAFFEGAMGYRIDYTRDIAVGNEEATYYMVTSGTHVNGGCCFDYGNAEYNNHDDGAGTMEAVYFGTATTWGKGQGAGPWVMADL